MARHAEQHLADEFIPIGKYDVPPENANHNTFNPSTHYYDKVRACYTFSTQATLHRVDAPTSSLGEDGNIRCRRCKNFELGFSGLNVKQQLKNAKRMKRHEEGCKGKKDERDRPNRKDATDEKWASLSDAGRWRKID